MNDSSAKVKQQLIEKIKASTNILVTVSKDPSVDALSAALGLTALLNKLDKHATAIFSGAIPPAISFLEPDKVFENTADSLRDFIIALDKEKADHLRYKVEDDLVKIYITPYRSTLTSDDLQFSQGEYNVELVLALGVNNQEDLDVALTAHQMLDNVTIITFSLGKQTSSLGSMDWHSNAASSLSEMVESLGETAKGEEPLLDKQIATALLTGIVSETERFSNDKTTARVMTVAAELMAVGADQQLIASKLADSHAITSLPTAANKTAKNGGVASEPTLSKSHDGNMSIQHGETAKVPTIGEILALRDDEKAKGEQVSNEMAKEHDSVFSVEASIPAGAEPMLGGTLNATSSQAEEDAKREFLADRNKTLLSHAYLSDDSEPGGAAINGIAAGEEETKPVDIFSEPALSEGAEPLKEPEPVPTIEPLDSELIEPQPEPEPAPESMPPIPEMPAPQPLPEPESQPEPQPEPDSTFEPIPTPIPNLPSSEPVPQPELEQPVVPEMPADGLPLPPEVPDFSTLPPVSTMPPDTEPVLTDSNVVAPPPMPEVPQTVSGNSTLPPAPSADDPSQFKIPGQN
jgi:hypothetical protein